MKKSNVILFAIAVVLSAFLLWLWFYLGFNHIDSPLDLVISIVWWVVVVALAALVAKVEKTRREKIRTAYVGPGFLFNSETGLVALEGGNVMDVLEKTLAGLEYNFNNVELEDEKKPAIAKVVRTKTYQPAQNNDEEPTWEGEVCDAAAGVQAVAFASRAELAELLGA